MLKVNIYENNKCEKEKFPYFNDKLDTCPLKLVIEEEEHKHTYYRWY